MLVRPETLTVDSGAPAEYRKLTQGAQRLSLNFRFRTGSADLDSRPRCAGPAPYFVICSPAAVICTCST